MASWYNNLKKQKKNDHFANLRTQVEDIIYNFEKNNNFDKINTDLLSDELKQIAVSFNMLIEKFKEKTEKNDTKWTEIKSKIEETIAENKSISAIRVEKEGLPEEQRDILSLFNMLCEKCKKEIDYQELRIKVINNAVSSGLWHMKIDGNMNVVQTTWSDDFRKMIGFHDLNDFPNELNSWSDRLHPEDAQNTLNAFGACISDFSGQTVYDVNYRLRLKDETYKWFRAAGHTIRDKDGKPLEIIGIFVNIDERVTQGRELDYTISRYELIDSILTEGSWNMRIAGKDPVNPDNEFW